MRTIKTGSMVVPAGATRTIGPLRAGTSIGVVPGAGGKMLAQSRVSPAGGLQNWTPGEVSAPASDALAGAVFEVVFTATTASGIAEWAVLE